MKKSIPIAYAGLAAATWLLSGCGGGDPPKVASTKAKTAPADVHDHPTEGPHHGDIVELGDEEFHAEIVHGADHEVTCYILDSKAKDAVPIDAPALMINLSHDGNAEQFRLVATPDAADPPGKSSRFALKDEELAADLDTADVVAKLVVNINGRSYTGKIAHRHEGDAQAHAHDEKAK